MISDAAQPSKRGSRWATVVALFSTLAAAPATRALEPSEPEVLLALVGGTLIDVDSGSRSERVTVLIERGRVTRVTTQAEGIPRHAKRIDVQGMWMVPGLIDMHVHAEGTDAPMELYLQGGVTSVRDVGGNLTRLRLLREAIEAGRTAGPRLFFCGPILDGRPPLAPSKYIMVDTPQIARSTIDFLADQGVNCIKTYNSISAEVLPVLLEAAARRGIPLTGHVPRSLSMRRVIEMGQRNLEHIRVTASDVMPPEEARAIDLLSYAEREVTLWEKVDLQSAPIKELIALLAQRQVVLVPTLAVDERLLVLDEADELAHPGNAILPKSVFDGWKGSWSAPNLTVPPQRRDSAARVFEKRKQFVKMCSDAGVRIVAGTDGPGLGTLLPGLGLQHELSLLVAAGLTPLQALRAATLDAAQALGSEDLGRIVSGARADLLVLAADPLVDIDNIGKIVAVVQNGRVLRQPETSSVESK